MNRTEAIAVITAKLASLDDEGVLAVVDIVQSMDADDRIPRPLTARELALIEQSKEDFQQGRTLTSARARVSTDDFLAKLGVPRSGT